MAERSQKSGAAMGQPVTRYARAGEVNIAYQVVGDGPVDLVWAYGLASNIEVFWEEPSLAAFLRRLSEFTRLILFDRRGCGLSDRHGTTATPTLEERMDDVLAVLDAVGSQRASIFGISRAARWRRCSRRPIRSGRHASSSTERSPTTTRTSDTQRAWATARSPASSKP